MSRRTRIAGMVAATVLLSTAALGAASAAWAASAPAIMNDVTRVDLAAATPNHSLKVYWQKNGTTKWKHQTVAGSGSVYSSPAVVRDGSLMLITAEGPNHSLKVYWGAPGGSWKHKTIAGNGTAYSAPSIAAGNGQVLIAFQGKNDTLRAFASSTLSTWETIVFSSGTAYSAPSAAVSANGGEFYLATREAGDQLYFWYSDDLALWYGVVPGATGTAPALALDGNLLLLAARGDFDSLHFYWAFASSPDSWNPEVVTSEALDVSAPAMSVNTGVSPSQINIAVEGPQHTALVFQQNTGASGWAGEVAGPANSTHSAPGVSSNAIGNLITAAGPSNSLLFFWSANGTTTWHPEKVAGAGSVA